MIPIGDVNPRQRFPWATILVILANTGIFFFMLLLPEYNRLQLYYLGGVIPFELIEYGGLGAWLTVFTSMFLHEGWMHLIGNMVFLWVFGDNIEDRYGPLGFLAIYILTGVVAVLTQVALEPSSQVPIIGASGAISGIAGVYLVRFPRARVRVLLTLIVFWRVIEVSAGVFLGIWFLWQLVQGVASVGAMAGGGVAWFAHVGGFVAGVIIAALFRGRTRTLETV